MPITIVWFRITTLGLILALLIRIEDMRSDNARNKRTIFRDMSREIMFNHYSINDAPVYTGKQQKLIFNKKIIKKNPRCRALTWLSARAQTGSSPNRSASISCLTFTISSGILTTYSHTHKNGKKHRFY